MYSGKSTRALPRVGFPIRTSRDQRLVSTYSGLFAAAHVLLRPLAPRHPPCALSLLIVKNTLCCRYGVFKVHAHLRAQLKNRPRKAGLSKLSSEVLDAEARLTPGAGFQEKLRRGRRDF